MDKIANLSSEERKELFSETAREMGVHPSIIEKDFWVVWILDKIFSDERSKNILMFKGGTSLSKVYNLIGRFSEDIDLILDWREVTDEDPQRDRGSKNKQVKFNEKVNKEALQYIQGNLMPILSETVSPICQCKIDRSNPYNIVVTYPRTFDNTYLRSEVLLEIGPLASWQPFGHFEIESYVAQYFPKIFKRTKCKVNAIEAKRTFWEKATILHQEANRDRSKNMPGRYSRHYYDLACIAKSPVKTEALLDLRLLEQVVDFKRKFYPATWAKFEEAKPGSFKLVPPDYRMKELQADYVAMGQMIFDKQLSFEEILEILQKLEDEINRCSHIGKNNSE